MVHLCAVVTSLCGLYKHKYARFYSILLMLNGLFVPLTVGLLSSGKVLFRIFWSNFEISVAIAGVYQIVEWQMEPWMALLFGVGQVVLKNFKNFKKILDRRAVTIFNMPITLHFVNFAPKFYFKSMQYWPTFHYNKLQSFKFWNSRLFLQDKRHFVGFYVVLFEC